MINKGNLLIKRLNGIVKRLCAIIIDFVTVIMICVMLESITNIVVMNTYITLFIGWKEIHNLMHILMLTLVPYIYFDILSFENGTLGNIIMNIYIKRWNLENPNRYQIFLRNFFNIYIVLFNILFFFSNDLKFYSKYILIINLLFLLLSDKGLSVGDLIAKTRVRYDKKQYRKIPKWINKKNAIIISLGVLLICLIILIIPPKLYIEQVLDTDDFRENYVFTRNKPMSDEKVFELIIEYDSKKSFQKKYTEYTESHERYYFPTQYEYSSLYGTSYITLNDEQKNEISNYTSKSEEFNRPIPVIVTYDYEEKIITYLWSTMNERYYKGFPLIE